MICDTDAPHSFACVSMVYLLLLYTLVIFIYAGKKNVKESKKFLKNTKSGYSAPIGNLVSLNNR